MPVAEKSEALDIGQPLHTQAATGARLQLPAYAASVLTQGGSQAHIVLGDQVYTLRITRAQKLILTK